MERKRVAGRFAAEDKSGVVKKRSAAASRTIQGNPQPVEVVENPAPKDTPRSSGNRAKNFVGLLLNSFKKGRGTEPSAVSTPAHIDSTE
jgi:hypothetical protein